MTQDTTNPAPDPAPPGEALDRRRRRSPLWVLGAGALFIFLVGLFPRISDAVTEIEGVPCDLSVDVKRPCAEVKTDEEGKPCDTKAGTDVVCEESDTVERVADTPLDLEDRPFVRIEKPSSEIIAWSGLGAFAAVSALALAMAARQWRTELIALPAPDGAIAPRARFGARRRSDVIVVSVLLVAGIAAVLFAAANRQYVSAILLFVLWVSATPAILSTLDCRSIAESVEWYPQADLPDRVSSLRHFGRLHDRFVALLGGQVTIYVIWLSADVRMRGEIENTELATQSGEFLNAPHNYGLVIIWGAFLTGLLALSYFPAASEIRQQAEQLTDEILGDLVEGAEPADYAESNKQRVAIAARLGVDQPLQARFQSAVVVAAPLLASVLSSLTG